MHLGVLCVFVVDYHRDTDTPSNSRVVNCATLRDMPKAKSKSKASLARKRSSVAPSKTKKLASRAKKNKLSAKSTKSNAGSRSLKNRIKRLTWEKNRDELLSIMFQTVYEDYQEGKFVPLFH